MSSQNDRLFPTIIRHGRVSGARSLNARLLAEIAALRARDELGRAWSKENYRGGYTSYASLSDLHHRAPVFTELAERLEPEARAFAKAQGWDLRGLELEMTNCWMNVMPRHTYHTLHLHPHSAISGVYYVSTPPGSVALKLEDPRMGLYMNAPVRSLGRDPKAALYHEIQPRSGGFVLFESWLRHEVPPNRSVEPRVSLSFNYSVELAGD